MMTFEETKILITKALGEEAVTEANEKALQPFLYVQAEKIAAVAALLKANGFEQLACITGIDNGEKAGTMEVIYNLYAILSATSLTLKVKINRNTENGQLPSVPTLAHVWRTANWLERETYDLLGIHFEGHPDMRRLLLPADWQGFPLRKDYQAQEEYHGVKVKY
jgi:NADH-quinone oxidoreductase subunit C